MICKGKSIEEIQIVYKATRKCVKVCQKRSVTFLSLIIAVIFGLTTTDQLLIWTAVGVCSLRYAVI